LKVHTLAITAHPDDIELGAAGTLAKMKSLGKNFGIADLTQGELGTRGTAEIRAQEAQEAAAILGADFRENLGLPDGFLANTQEQQLEVIKIIRKYQPEIILTNAPKDRHPDHGNGSTLVEQASFMAGLTKIPTFWNGVQQDAWRPLKIYHIIQFWNLEPTFLVDISGFMEIKMKSVMAYKSQFYNPESDEPKTLISSQGFLESVEYRAKDLGRHIYVDYAEGFISNRPIGISDLSHLL
jgi:bacillithiol biosynthesis deacetylase BshB1